MPDQFKDEWEDTDEGITSTDDPSEPLEKDPNQDPPGPGLNPCHKASPPPTLFEEGWDPKTHFPYK